VTARFDERAGEVLVSEEAVRRHDTAVYDLRTRRDAAVAEVPDWEALRERASGIKAHLLDHLDRYLEHFEERARAAGVRVHWAVDAAGANRIISELLTSRAVRSVIKSKSMLTEECGLNPELEARGIEVVDTDLGERIVQLAGEPPSHIIVPAIHRSRYEVGELFHRTMGTPQGESDPERLTRLARADLREKFIRADAAITGVNFAVAETGSIVVVTNEGNADLGMSLPNVHIACMGLEKLIPAMSDLPVFLRLLARSATGQPISVYTSIVTGPRPGAELHVVIVDNGRSELLAADGHREALGCIRCGACLNTCPVYRKAGGYSYDQPIPGPIGAVLAPALRAKQGGAELAHASSLCGSCSAVCPVRIDLHGQLLAWRREVSTAGPGERLATSAAGSVLKRPGLLNGAGRTAERFWSLLGRRFKGNPAGPWLDGRELPAHPGESFRARWLRTRGERS
jgi:L-lactate dehydrogenase complex protein LldF